MTKKFVARMQQAAEGRDFLHENAWVRMNWCDTAGNGKFRLVKSWLAIDFNIST
jgi:hypothetical protein